LYETPDWNEARSILETYDISYIVVGNIERNKYSTIEQKFVENMPVVFQQGNTTIYLMP
jgi:uncharacterized membrane protein